MTPKSGFLWIILLLILSSCVSYEKYSMEVLKPSDYSIPPEVKKIAIVSRNLKYQNDTLQNFHMRGNRLIKDKTPTVSDSLLIKTCFDSLSVKLLAKSSLDSLHVLPVNAFPVTRTKEIRPFKTEWYKNITEKTGADGLILLDMFSCFYKQSESRPTDFASVITSSIWSFYDGKQKQITNRFTHIDTLQWDGMDENGVSTKLRIPAKNDALLLAAGVIGENYSTHLIPSWTMVYRDIMWCGKPEFKTALKLATKNKWDEASVIWQKYVESNSRRNKIIALYNLALASEMNGDIDQAIELTDQAAKESSGAFMAPENEAVRRYSVVLHKRKLEINQLNSRHDLR
jgi:hypothetical protein